jgi:hypothetical protein
MTDYDLVMRRALEGNIRRYTRLLSTNLTSLEKDYVKRRLAEDRLALRRLRDTADGPSGRNIRRRPPSSGPAMELAV